MIKKMKILLVGCGAISRHWFEYTLSRSDCEIVGVVDINLDSANDKISKYELKCPAYTSIDDALKSEIPDIVYDLSFVTTHHEVTMKAFKAGCHVFTEKPMTIDRQSADDLVGTAKKLGLTYSVMQNRRYQKPVQALKELIKSGRLGKIWTVSAEIFVGADLASIRNNLESPMLQDNAVHTFDTARYITGAEPQNVYCHSYNPVESKYKGDAAGVCIFEMSDNSVFVYNCVMGVDGLNTSWESSWRIIGSNGSVIWDGVNAPVAEIVVDRTEGTRYERLEPATSWNGKNQHFGCLEEMFDAFLNNRLSETSGEDNYKSISMVFASLESAKACQKVTVLS
ncbi:MAG: Gfo/Idh/MocA family protein [Eubacteriales bacterium]